MEFPLLAWGARNSPALFGQPGADLATAKDKCPLNRISPSTWPGVCSPSHQTNRLLSRQYYCLNSVEKVGPHLVERESEGESLLSPLPPSLFLSLSHSLELLRPLGVPRPQLLSTRMARTWLINGRAIAGKVKNATSFSNYQIKELGIEAHRECPNCKHLIDNSDVSLEWPGLPAGVKFDPTDVELIQHLAGKVGLINSKSHIFIDEFIPTLEEDQGICYTHPKNLPGVKRDGSSVHFFHRISNAYATGCRKRRKIHGECNGTSGERVRWHKTGKTKPVMENGVQKGWKKIMVLYRSLKKGCKPDKANWVMHQYHLGIDEEEKDGELVVSKIFFQQNAKQMDKGDTEEVDESDGLTVGTGPRTPTTVIPEPPRPEKQSPLSDAYEYDPLLFIQKEQHPEIEVPLSVGKQNDDDANSLWLAGESQAVEEFDPKALEQSLLCHEVLENFSHADEPSFHLSYSDLDHGRNNMVDRNPNAGCLFSELDNIPIDTPPDFHLADLQFGSQDSISSWLDRL